MNAARRQRPRPMQPQKATGANATDKLSAISSSVRGLTPFFRFQPLLISASTDHIFLQPPRQYLNKRYVLSFGCIGTSLRRPLPPHFLHGGGSDSPAWLRRLGDGGKSLSIASIAIDLLLGFLKHYPCPSKGIFRRGASMACPYRMSLQDQIAQYVALDLAAARHRQFAELLDRFRKLVVGNLIAQEGDEFVERRDLVALGNNAKAIAFAKANVGHADHGGVQHLRDGRRGSPRPRAGRISCRRG